MSYGILVSIRLRIDPISVCARLVSLAGTALTSKPQANLKSVAAAALSGNGFPDRYTTCNRHGRGLHVAGGTPRHVSATGGCHAENARAFH